MTAEIDLTMKAYRAESLQMMKALPLEHLRTGVQRTSYRMLSQDSMSSHYRKIELCCGE